MSATATNDLAERNLVSRGKPTPQGSRAGTEVSSDEAWKEQVRKKKGILLSIDGIQPDAGNETISLLRDVLTGRRLHAENTTESTKERVKPLLLG